MITRVEQHDGPIMDFLFSSSETECEEEDVYSINATIIIYESKDHHCLLEYRIKYRKTHNGVEFTDNTAELIGDSLVIFQNDPTMHKNHV